jgi:hypothetical protein
MGDYTKKRFNKLHEKIKKYVIFKNYVYLYKKKPCV